MANLFDLTGKVAVVTGASSGLGADAAIAYAQHGADVALLARRKDRLDALAEEIKKMGKRALAVQCDVGSEESVKNAVDEVVAYFGKIDILLNNAGVAFLGRVDNLSLKHWNKTMDINVTGVFLMSKYVIPHMLKQKYGKVVNVSSSNAIQADKGWDLARHQYNTSKAAVLGMTMAMAATYMAENITVNAVLPGLFESEMTPALFAHEEFLNMYNTQCPAGRPAKQGELNGAIIFLSSDASSYVTSQHIVVDGGVSIV